MYFQYFTILKCSNCFLLTFSPSLLSLSRIVARPMKTRTQCAGTTLTAVHLPLCLGVLSIYMHQADEGKEVCKRWAWQ